MFIEPYIQIRSNQIFQYNLIPRLPVSSEIQALRDEKQSKLYQNMIECPTYSGTLKAGAKKRLTKAIEFMVMSTTEKFVLDPATGSYRKFRMSFITLTVYSTDRMIDGKEAHKTVLEPFLQWMRRKHKCFLYLWKAELQKRGQIHYHITSDVFINHKDIRDKWNDLQKKAGYLDSFHQKYGHYNPNSTDVHSVKKIVNLSGYLIKEIVKGFQNNASLGGKVWDCSLNLKSAKYFVTVADGHYQERIAEMIDKNEVQAVYTDHCTIFRVINKPAHVVLSDRDKAEYEQIMYNVRSKEAPKITIVKKEQYILPEYKPQPAKIIVNWNVQTDLFSSS